MVCTMSRKTNWKVAKHQALVLRYLDMYSSSSVTGDAQRRPYIVINKVIWVDEHELSH
jgi:hypothetical protein